MMVSDEEKRWLVVGIAMNKVAAPVIRNYIKQEMDTHYTNNTYCHGLTTPCTMATLTYHHVNADPNLRRLKFQNINNNLHNHGNRKNLYNYNVNSSVDLARLFLPDYLAEFSAFDESLDMSAMLRLLGFNNPAPIFLSPLISIQTSADDVRENVRNKWGHCNVTEWTEVLFNDCFSKLETLVRSLGLTGGVEKMALDQLSDWQTKGCQLCMGHAVDKNLLSLVQQDVQELIKKLKKTKEEQTANQEATNLQLEKHDEELKEVLEWRKQQMKENEIIMVKLVALEEVWTRLQGVEDDVSEVKAQISQTDEKVKQLEENVRDLTVKDDRPTNSTVGSFDVKTCRSKLAEHYKRTAKVPTSVWSKKSPVDIHQIYTRLSWVKEEQTPAGSSKSKLGHYRDLFTADEKGVERKRILVQGQTGIGKSTFVKKLAVDWAELDDEKTEGKEQKRQDDEGTSSEDDEDTSSDEFENMSTDDTSSDKYEDASGEEYEDTSGGSKDEEQNAALKKFKLVLVINLKEASKCPSFKDVIRHCHIFPEEDTALVEDMLNYVMKNQEKVLLVVDSYDEYHCGSNSEIFEIFRGNKLRNCCVLMTTRNSKADDLREFKDVHAEITGFSKKDRKTFMRRKLGGEEEANELRRHLSQKSLTGLTRVPLLLLFFCTLWKKEKLKSFPETKTKLYLAIVQYVLDYNQGKHSPTRFRKIEDFKEILAEIGQVALECLLKDDHVFEYDQLSDAILCEESRLHIIGLLQVTEYAENLRPAGMVSFIHKSIQEFLAAWYITYRCVPEGNLGKIEQHARTLKDCDALENVFQFICGLSDDGAVKVIQHFASVSISDPTLDVLDFSGFWTKPDVEKETDVPPCDITAAHWRFSDLVYSSFQEVSSKAELFSSCLECTGRMVHVTEQIFGFLQAIDVKDLTQFMYSGKCHLQQHSFLGETLTTLCKLVEILNLPDVLPSAPESSKLLTQREGERTIPSCWCSFSYILLFRSGQYQFYITGLELNCDDHARLFTETPTNAVPSLVRKLCSGQSHLKFLTSLKCSDCSGQTCLALGATIRNCKHLNSIEVKKCHDSICDILEQVPDPSKCSLKIAGCELTSAGAVKLASLLPTFTILTLDLNLRNCCSPALDTLFTSITHKTLETLELTGINLTATAVVALGQSLPEMSSLRSLKLWGEGILQTVDLAALFGSFNKPLPLQGFNFHGFSVRGSIAPLTNAFRFFPNLRELHLADFNEDAHNLCCLLDSLRFVPNLMKLSVSGKPESTSHCCGAEVSTVRGGFTHNALKVLVLSGITLTPEVAAALARSLPGLLTLEELHFIGSHRSTWQAEEMKTLFGGFSKTLPLTKLSFSVFSVTGCLAPVIKSFRFFPDLTELELGGSCGEISMNEHSLCGLLESLSFLPNLKTLSVKGKPPSQEHCCTEEINTLLASITHKSLEKLKLDGISLTPKAATLLGRSLPKMSSLQELQLIEVDGSTLQTEEMEALFGGLDKTLALCKLNLQDFIVKGCVSPLITKNVFLFRNLRDFHVKLLNVDENTCSLLKSLEILPDVGALNISEYRGHASGVESLKLERGRMNLHGITLTPAVAAALDRVIPEMPLLRGLKLEGAHNESILQAEDMKALFGGFNKTLPLYKLSLTGYSLRGCLVPLTESLHLFPHLWELKLTGFNTDEHDLCGLLGSLNVMPNLMTLSVSGKPQNQEHCCTAEVNTLASISHKSIEELKLYGISLTPAVATALGQLLPEMPSLRELELTGAHGSILEAEEMEALFGGFNKISHLTKLTFDGFRVRSSFAPLTKSFRFFPNLRELYLGEYKAEVNVDDEHNLCSLLESLRFTPCLRTLIVTGKPLIEAHFFTEIFSLNTRMRASITHKSLVRLHLNGLTMTSAVAVALGQLLPEMLSLEELELTGLDGSILQSEEMKALFGGIDKTLPLNDLTFRGFGVRGCLEPLTECFRFFPELRTLCLKQLNMDEHDVCSLLENLRFIPNVRAFSVRADNQGDVLCCKMELPTDRFDDEDKLNLEFEGINLTPAVATLIGQLLSEMSSLQQLEITGVDAGCILQSNEMEALFGGFHKTLPLTKLTFSGFSVTGHLAPLSKSFRFFPNVEQLCLEQLNMDEHDLCSLLENVRFMPNLRALSVKADHQEDARCYTTELPGFRIFAFQEPKKLNLDGITLTPEAAASLGRSLSELSSLQELEISGANDSILQINEMEALFGGFNKTLPLTKLSFSGFNVRGCLAPLTKSLQFFPNFTDLDLRKLNIAERDLFGLLENFRLIPYLQKTNLSHNPLGHAVRSIVPHISNLKRLEYLWIDETGHSEEDFSYVRDALQQVLPNLKIN